MESITIWATAYADIFIVGSYLNSYYIGIYKTSMTTVNQFTTIITAATIPVLFSALCRLQNDFREFENMLLKFQKIVGIMVVPIGIGIFLFSDVVKFVML
ncbi:MAG: oligosaccharide flippase family protein [Spirochaetales bacterium]|nr:oligosaccharide flippase family protein [Spirochaetales bacterium]